MLVDLDVMEVRPNADVNDVCVKYKSVSSINDADTDKLGLWQQWLNQWFIVGTPMTAQGSRCTIRPPIIAPQKLAVCRMTGRLSSRI